MKIDKFAENNKNEKHVQVGIYLPQLGSLDLESLGVIVVK